MFENEARDIFGGMILEKSDKAIFEEAADAGSMDDFATKQTRSQAMSCVLAWVESGDYTFEALAGSAEAIADLDGDEEFSEDEEDYYNELLAEIAFALTSLGADAENVQSFMDEEDDAAGEKIGEFLSGKMADVPDEDEEIIANYAISNQPIMESMIKVIRAGKVTLKKKRIRKVKLSAAQKAGLKKARRKAFTGAAKLKRKKSMKIRAKRGM